MRFLNLTITAPDIGDVKFEFNEGVNIISISDERLFELLKYFPLISLYGSQQKELYRDIKEISSDINIFSSAENFIMSSFYYPELEFNNIDLIFEKDKIKQLLINSEISRLKFPYFMRREELLLSKEKELIDLEREKQQYELKKIKRERLLKDINSLKKDIIELNEIKDKIKSIENSISERFPQFSNWGEDQLPDPELVQKSFNSFRDINEQIDKFSVNKKKYSTALIKIIFSSVIFSLIALMFLIFTSSASLILTFISSISAGIAVITALIYYLTIRRSYPTELIEKKNHIENNLLDILKKNNFPVDDYKTGELYEILFQYFDDFIDFREINNELVSLRKKISNSTLAEKEKKLKQLMNEINKIDEAVNQTIDNILEEIIKNINNLTDEIKHIKFLDTVFNEAVERWSKSKLDELSNSAIEKIMKITDNSYTREELGECLKNVMLSSGKLNEEYIGLKPFIVFAIMAALSEQLNFTLCPPMFMIEPFIPNNEFSENMKKLLPEFFPDRQVIIIINDNDTEM